MTCKCGSTRIMDFQGKCSDMSSTEIPHLAFEYEGYVPSYGIGSGDYVRLQVCLDCGQIQDWTSITDEDIKTSEEYIQKFGDEEEQEAEAELVGAEPDVITIKRVTTTGKQVTEESHEVNRLRLILQNAFGLNWASKEEAQEILLHELQEPTAANITQQAIRQLLKECNK